MPPHGRTGRFAPPPRRAAALPGRVRSPAECQEKRCADRSRQTDQEPRPSGLTDPDEQAEHQRHARYDLDTAGEHGMRVAGPHTEAGEPFCRTAQSATAEDVVQPVSQEHRTDHSAEDEESEVGRRPDRNVTVAPEASHRSWSAPLNTRVPPVTA
ncbi:hypothetical protein GCM10010423_30460 [Streptomyces levis]|uniref:Uncharacterized protein n=1 Tax=Streptomyces levis TaxID=285566 RepID=A0ABN3NRY0_9ACTN